MGTTQRFGLSTVGGPFGGSLTEDGYKFTGTDRELIDRILQALENHTHGGGDRLGDPTDPPTAALDTVGGTLSSGMTYHYRVSFVDQFGLESAGSPEVAIVMPASVAVPGAPLLAAQVGGTLAEGVYYYGITAYAGSEQTPLGPAAVITLLPDRGSVELTMPAIPVGADSLAVWRQGPDEPGFTQIATGIVAATYLDDGSVAADPCACDPANMPPSDNRTSSSNTVTITVPHSVDVQSGGLIKKWRLYRTTVSGAYSSSSLVAEVSDIVEATGLLATTYTDRGGVLLPGRPVDVSQTLTPSNRVVALGGGGSGGHFFLNDSSGATWRVVTTLDGVLETWVLDNPVASAPEAVNFRAANGVVWRLTVSTDGALVTTNMGATAASDEYLYEVGGGPHVASPDPQDTWQLAVEVDGSLTTIGGQDTFSTVVLGEGTRRVTVAAAPPVDGVEGDIWIKPSAGEAAGANPHNTTLADLAGHVTNQDVEITDATRGVILRAPGGARFRITVGDGGALTTAAL